MVDEYRRFVLVLTFDSNMVLKPFQGVVLEFEGQVDVLVVGVEWTENPVPTSENQRGMVSGSAMFLVKV